VWSITPGHNIILSCIYFFLYSPAFIFFLYHLQYSPVFIFFSTLLYLFFSLSFTILSCIYFFLYHLQYSPVFIFSLSFTILSCIYFFLYHLYFIFNLIRTFPAIKNLNSCINFYQDS
jgi:hypothetical protein